MAEKSTFQSVIKTVGESEDEFQLRLREEARCCDFQKFKTVANPEVEFMKTMISSEVMKPETKLRQLDVIKAKAAMSVIEMAESLKKILKKTFRSPNKKIRQIKAPIGALCVVKAYHNRLCSALGGKYNTAKKRHTSQRCVEANPSQLQLSFKNKNSIVKK